MLGQRMIPFGTRTSLRSRNLRDEHVLLQDFGLLLFPIQEFVGDSEVEEAHYSQ